MKIDDRKYLGFRGQLGLLLWKNILVHCYSIRMTITEVFLPLSGPLLLLLIRGSVDLVKEREPTFYPSRSLGPAAAGKLLAADQYKPVVLYAPETELVQTLITGIRRVVKADNVKAVFTGFPSESELERFYLEDENRSKIVSLAVVFDVDDNATEWPASVTYKIRPPTANGTAWHTAFALPFYLAASPRQNDNLYYESGFLYMQKTLDIAILKAWKPKSFIGLSAAFVRRMPFPPYFDDPLHTVVRVVFPTVTMLSVMVSAIAMSRSIVLEKENQLKESVQVAGVREEAIWMSWFLDFFSCLLLPSVGNTFLMCLVKVGDRALLPNSDPSLIFFFFLCYSMSVIAFTFFASSLVSKVSTGTLVTGICFFLTHVPYFLLSRNYEEMTLGGKVASCLLFNTAMAFGVIVISSHEGAGNGAKWSNVVSPPTTADNLGFHYILIMLVVDAVILFFLAWYFDKVCPREYGVPQPWNFLFLGSYWSKSPRRLTRFSEIDLEGPCSDIAYFEREPSGLPMGIRLSRLRKVFPNGKVAVRNFTLNIFEDQITVLLGHNGAGKSTTMSMLTGFITPTSGTAFVNGYDIRMDIVDARRSLGLCPQNNIFFETLTVEEHLTFFALLKGCKKKAVPSLVQGMARDLGLLYKLKAVVGTLTGGQKRRLCVAIALIGGSKVVILDEPTYGMDPISRRLTWKTLKRNRAGRTILLTTHYMDEADILGDRIVIMAEGIVQCCGTPLYLKKVYGTGYHLIILKTSDCKITNVTAAIQMIIETATLERSAGAELYYRLPAEETSKFPELFTMLESTAQALDISSFGVTATTMEEVFHVVYSSYLSDQKQSAIGSNAGTSADSKHFAATKSQETKQVLQKGPSEEDKMCEAFTKLNTRSRRLTSCELQLSRLYGMFVKKAIITLRNRKMTAVQIALPVLFTIFPVMTGLSSRRQTDEPPMKLDLDMFRKTHTGYSTGIPNSSATTRIGNAYRSLFSSPNTVETVDPTASWNMNRYFLNLSQTLNLLQYTTTVVIGAEFSPDFSGAPSPTDAVAMAAWYSGQTFHGEGVSLAYVMNAYARTVIGHDDHTITTINHPLPRSQDERSRQVVMTATVHAFVLSFCMLFGMAFLTASFSYFLIRERQTGAKHLQMVSGVDPLSFWLSTFAWDFIIFLIPMLMILVVFEAFQVQPFTEDYNIAVVFLVLVAYGVAVLPYVYVIQFLFTVPANGVVSLVFLTFLTGLLTLLVSLILHIPGLLKTAPDQMERVLRILFPHFCVSNSLFGIYTNKYSKDFCKDYHDEKCQELEEKGLTHVCCKGICGKTCFPHEDNYLSLTYPGVGSNIFCLLGQGIFCFTVVLMVDFNLLQKLLYVFQTGEEGYTPPGEDRDVQEERERVLAGGAQGNPLLLDDLYKQYGQLVAVDHVFLGVPQQECIGLLGQNGAGKTTIFKILTGDIMVSSGNAYVLQYNVKTDIKQAQANMGYCPQFDALIEQMTGRETLYMYARLRGVPENIIPRLVSSLLSALMLTQDADDVCSQYSGGNKRKLSAAIALIGSPAVTLLDEPTSGMDPGARRQLWTFLSNMRTSGRTLVLTSHSMEECEALCTRLAIMVNGRCQCLGSLQYLKNKFSQGSIVKVKMASQPRGSHASVSRLAHFLFKRFPGTRKLEDQEGYAAFQIANASIPLSLLFAIMERCKKEYSVEDFSVYQTSLEQIFTRLARTQSGPRVAQAECYSPLFNCLCPTVR